MLVAGTRIYIYIIIHDIFLHILFRFLLLYFQKWLIISSHPHMTIQDGSPILHIPTEDPTVRIIIVIIFIAVTEHFVYTWSVNTDLFLRCNILIWPINCWLQVHVYKYIYKYIYISFIWWVPEYWHETNSNEMF